MNTLLTIFTPTFNRAHTLTRLHNSLAMQTCQKFEWLVIDDGSTDNTEELIASFVKENKINIRYIRQENSGKQAAWNKAVESAYGGLFCGVDSDDIIYNDSLDAILKKYSLMLLNDYEVVALRCSAISSRTNYIDAKEISKNPLKSCYYNELVSMDKIGERVDIYKTDALRKTLFPIDKETKFIPEIWLYIQLTEKNFKFIYINDVLGFFYDETDERRLSRAPILNNVKGNLIATDAMVKCIPLRVWVLNPTLFVKTLFKYVRCYAFCENKSSYKLNFFIYIVYFLFFPFFYIELKLRALKSDS